MLQSEQVDATRFLRNQPTALTSGHEVSEDFGSVNDPGGRMKTKTEELLLKPDPGLQRWFRLFIPPQSLD